MKTLKANKRPVARQISSQIGRFSLELLQIFPCFPRTPMTHSITSKPLTLSLLAVLFLILVPITKAQKVESRDRERGQIMLMRIKDQLKKNYYDPEFRGIDLDTRFQAASEKIKEASPVGQIFGTIAQVLIE